MADVDRDKMREIKAFPELVRYLQDELNWPIKPYDFEDLFFEYQPDELGIDAKSAAKIEEIKQLRPMVDGQPWGIFFVKFAPKRLPIVALRRILSSLAIKKRASAKISEMATWQLNDLLFISNYGENDQRQITFAHFSQDEQSTDLPTLRVLGWDDADTALHIDHVQNELQQKLSWPKNERDIELWQKNWASAFTLRHREVITTSRDLAVRLAALARQIRNRVNAILAIEIEAGPISKLHRAFREALIHDLSEDDFADTYAQTIAYGLLSARLANPKGRTADELAIQMPVTNPFLKELMDTFLNIGGRKSKAGGVGIDFDELGVSEVVELLNHSDMEAVIRDFGDKNPQEDPVIHFYELFLKEYDSKKRIQRGVFYTPRPVVSYIVRSVDELLRTEFGLEDGLADTTTWGEMATRHKDLKIPDGVPTDQAFVQILDPATGTGTFLVEVIEVIYRTMKKKWETDAGGPLLANVQERWNAYVPDYLLPRLHGYELLMAPYAIAHLKVGLKLYETGYQFKSNERARIFLTNTLEPEQDFSGKFKFMIPAFAHEAKEVNKIKRNQCFTVLVGNPPYAVTSSNYGDWITHLVKKEYYPKDEIRELNPKLLLDDYVKFLRFSQWAISLAKVGILGLITNNGYLDNPTFRQLRRNIIQQFKAISIVNLHGSLRKKEKTPSGGIDENVFEIQQGVSILIAAKHPTSSNITKIEYLDIWGKRETKYQELHEGCLHKNAYIVPIHPCHQFYMFVPQDSKRTAEYENGIKIVDAFQLFSSGMNTLHDEFAISFEREQPRKLIADLLDIKINDDGLRQKYKVADSRDWKLAACRKQLSNTSKEEIESKINLCIYRPFDYRWIILHNSIVTYPRWETTRQFLYSNSLGFAANRQSSKSLSVFAAKIPFGQHKIADPYDRSYIFPIYIYHEALNFKAEEKTPFQDQQIDRRPNYKEYFLQKLALALGLEQEQSYKLPIGISNEQIFYYIYSVFQSPLYRDLFSDFFKVDFPRIPLPGSIALFLDLAKIGSELVSLHIMESTKLTTFITCFVGSNNLKIGRIWWSEDTVWIDAFGEKIRNTASLKKCGFRGVPEAVWNFHIGGYQVCEKWLKDRKGRVLSQEDIEHYQKIIVALSETIRIMAEIDQVIEKYGGWPGAFKS